MPKKSASVNNAPERVDSDEKSSLNYSESVTYARVRASDERH